MNSTSEIIDSSAEIEQRFSIALADHSCYGVVEEVMMRSS